MQENTIVKASISKQIAEQLRAAIVAGQFKIGQRLPTEDELAQRFGVSRPSVREALKRLAAQNLVRAKRGPTGGNFVVQPSYAELAESLSGAATLLVGIGPLALKKSSRRGVLCRAAVWILPRVMQAKPISRISKLP